MKAFPNLRPFLNFYMINVLIIVIYNIVLWSIIFHYFDEGGASLGPGLSLIALTLLHLLLLVIYWVMATLIKLMRKK